MNTKKIRTKKRNRTTIALVAMIAAITARAETMPTSAPVGTLGQQYAELSFGGQDIQRIAPDFYNLALAGNVPITKSLDLGGAYEYGWISGPMRGHANLIKTNATVYTALKGVKPFAGVGLGYQFDSFAGGVKDNFAVWSLSTGVEIPVGAISITPRIVYGDDFRGSSNSTQQVTAEAVGNYWISRTSAIFASVGRTDVLRRSADSWNYRVGYRMKF